ncbi:hypothetical protein HAZT_HAZT000800 [Hyalella azteca]|nr:hypothetical protein HAZT_HAZT000800 [Hyalella azteca]
MADIPKTPPWTPGMPLPDAGVLYDKKYSDQDIRLLENEVCAGHLRKTVGGGLCLLLEEWGCSGVVRPTIADLINLLDRHKCAIASSFLRTHVLRERSSENPNQDFLALDNLLNENSGCSKSDAVVSFNEQSAGKLAHIVDGEPELDNLLAHHNQAAAEDEITSNNKGVSGAITYPSLERLVMGDGNSHNADGVNASLAHRDPVELDSSLPLVPHISYEILYKITDGFCETPHARGGRKLGEGAFGVVYKAEISVKDLWGNDTTAFHRSSLLQQEENSDVKQLAIKKLNIADERVDKQFKTEVEILSQCNHVNILPLEGYSCDGPHWCLLYAFMLHGNLQDRLACCNDTQPLTWKQRLSIGEGTAEGLAYLHTFHNQPMIHRDVKSANILLDVNMQPKVGDFGLVRMGSNGSRTGTNIKTTTVFGTSAYMAPEAFRGDVSTKMDTFSYGVVMLELITGLPPYDECRDGRDLLSHIEEYESLPATLCDTKAGAWPSGLPEALFELAMLCFEDKRTRPSMVDVKSLWKDLRKRFN